MAVVLGAALSVVPGVSIAQSGPVPQAMVEGSISDVNSWGFAAQVPVGGSITWTNEGSLGHSVTATDGSFDSGIVAVGDSATIEFDTPGIYNYVCTPHPWMKGTVVVSADAPATSSMAMVEGSQTDINSYAFAVAVPAGQQVVWANLGSQQHSATSTSGAFDTGLVNPGDSAPLEFDTPGIYPYQCAPHPWMKGTVVVN
jgi:plastocyanin